MILLLLRAVRLELHRGEVEVEAVVARSPP